MCYTHIWCFIMHIQSNSYYGTSPMFLYITTRLIDIVLSIALTFFKSMEKEFPQWYLHHVEAILFAKWMACMHQWTQKLSAAASLLAGSPALDRFQAGCCSVWCALILHTGVEELRILKLLARQVQHRQLRKRKDIVTDIKAAYNEC